MIGYGAAELAASFRTVRKNTIQIAEEIPEDRYGFSPAAGARSVAQLLSHIVFAPILQEDMHRTRRVTILENYDFGAMGRQIAEKEKQLRSKSEILAALTADGERVATWLASLDDDFLAERFTGNAGQISRTRFESILSIKEHEMHHRGQLMLMQRMLGLVPHLTRQREERIRQRAAAAAARV